MPGRRPGHMPGHTPDVTPGHTPEVTPGHTPDVTPGQAAGLTQHTGVPGLMPSQQGPHVAPPLLTFLPGTRQGVLLGRRKRFFIDFLLDGQHCVAHTNNSGSMLGLLRPGSAVLVSPATNPGRKLAWTLELVGHGSGEGLGGAGKAGRGGTKEPDARETGKEPAARATGKEPAARETSRETAAREESGQGGSEPRAAVPGDFWVGVNTLTPNRLLKAAFAARRLPWAQGYTRLQPEAKRGASRLDALLTGPGLPPLWVECKNVTLVEDGVAAFPDAVTTRGQKHMREMMDIVASGERAAFFYCIQRPDGRCFGPADYVDPDYAALFYQSLAAGVAAHPHRVMCGPDGLDLGEELPVVPL